jgi:diazepam-binding inhibitor (GABA receptor modulating acyl-CoA-binding protein)
MTLDNPLTELEKKFNKYVLKASVVKDTISIEDKLYLYSFYKQTLFGDNNSEKPSIFDRIAMEKWKTWNLIKGTSKEESIYNYIQKVKEIYHKNKKT